MKTMNQFLTLALLSFFSFVSLAEVNFQGFASFVGGATLDKDDTPYLGYENKLGYDKNSLYALQASSDMGDGLTVTGQLIARGNQNYKPEFEWLYASYNLTPTLNAKIGRIRTPFYMFSEYLEVGYTYHWIRPPIELYAAQVTNMDGVSFLYNFPMGSVDSQYMISIGNRDTFSDNPEFTTSDYKPLIAANAQFEYGPYTGKLIYTQGDITIDTTNAELVAAQNGLAALDATFAEEHAQISDSTVIFAGFAAEMNFHPLKILIEYSTIDFDSIVLIPDETRMLASAAYGVTDSFLIHYSWSANEKEGESDLAGKATGAVAQATAQAIIDGTERDTTTHTVGIRYDFHESAAFKTEIISTEETKLDTEATLLRFGIDMLF